MFLGHFGLSFAGKRLAPDVSLGTLFLATQWADLLFWVLTLVGIEHFRIAPGATRVTPMDFYDYPWSHSLVGLAAWGVLLGGLYLLFRKSRAGLWVLAAGVASHWVLDALVHRPDMPVGIQGPYAGLSLWNSVPLTVAAEAIFFGGGIVLYLRATTARDRTGVWAFWALVAFLAVTWVASIAGPPPPSERVVEVTGAAMWLFVPWGWWIDRHRIIVRA
jgi:LexA-binding, inner membrane-associated putative hydrolase